MDIKIAGIIPESIVDGFGIRFSIFVQGCPHKCFECHNPQTHDFKGGKTMKVEDIFQQIKKSKLIQGITISGGEPFCQPNACLALAQAAQRFGKNIILYSGYTYEEIMTMGKKCLAILELLKTAFILIDGPYVKDQKDLKLAFRGSSNQRIIDVPLSLSTGDVILKEGIK